MWFLLACAPDSADTAKSTDDDLPADADGDGLSGDDDCDDADATTHIYADELCDGRDNDCDGAVDNGLTSTWYRDRDEDGFGDEASPVEACEPPDGYIADATDCDDRDEDVHPGAEESDCADPTDSNCDGSVGYADDDGDGWAACEECDDASALVHPGGDETCNEIDDDCDGRIDVGASDAGTWYADADDDGHGGTLTAVECDPPDGFLSTSDDCDDGDSTAFPGADETCDGVDDDCDGRIDEDAIDTVTTYDDADLDGWGDPATAASACEGATTAGDCDDTDHTIHPDAIEVCNAIDDDCDGTVDDDAIDVSTFYEDADGDGYGDAATTGCVAPAGAVATDGDCDDADPGTYPTAPETCDGEDQDCDGIIDDGIGTDWYLDADGDGFGNPDRAWSDCDPPTGYVSDATDCDDLDAGVQDGYVWFADDDGDGWGDALDNLIACDRPASYVAPSGDCNDGDEEVNPDGIELCNSVDDDCDATVDNDATDEATWYDDDDGDGLGDDGESELACDAPSGFVAVGGDCDDTDATVTECKFTDFDGTYGTTWETLKDGTEHLYSLQSYHPADMDYIYNMYDTTGQKYDPAANTWTTLSAVAPYTEAWTSMAPFDGYLWMIRNNAVYRYHPDTDDWDTMASVSGGDDLNMTESDEYGIIYGHTSSGYIVEYDTDSGGLTYNYTGLGGEHETRMGYDPDGRAIFFGSYSARYLYRWDIASGVVTQMSDIPENQLNDIFCSDRSGHIYAAGDSSGTTMFQYDMVANSWKSIPSLPSDHTNNGSCVVSADGWLYVSTGSNQKFYRLALY